jgi:hypothetical protein
MTNPQIKIVNCETGEEIVRDANTEEISQLEIDSEMDLATRAEILAKAKQRQEILDRLGLTADEAKLLLG